MAAINFFSEDTAFVPQKKLFLKRWIKGCIEDAGFKPKELNFIFCSDPYLLVINKQYLQHDTLTDIITFDNSLKPNVLSGDIFISIDRVRENAETFGVSVFDEMCRIIIHGTLHLLGYKDKTKKDKAEMTAMEDRCLQKRTEI
ncbi:rRNA maturation RNase YbeY [Pedobacter sp. SYP-B3415]|uniref:rRNA maturation RNase YbeY n=1 Tax=Pedobacter sp. SYP-B3415 TaxID=2496641 RepID=UPI00101CC1D4|nr:rRNA maturation RNase YbeY [Pedobacter sp. SYP-B3415]